MSNKNALQKGVLINKSALSKTVFLKSAIKYKTAFLKSALKNKTAFLKSAHKYKTAFFNIQLIKNSRNHKTCCGCVATPSNMRLLNNKTCTRPIPRLIFTMSKTHLLSFCSRLCSSFLSISLLGIVTEATDTLDGLRKQGANVGKKEHG